jgi:hypothetical protein
MPPFAGLRSRILRNAKAQKKPGSGAKGKEPKKRGEPEKTDAENKRHGKFLNGSFYY